MTTMRKSVGILMIAPLALAAFATLGAVQIAASAATSSPTLADRFEAFHEPIR